MANSKIIGGIAVLALAFTSPALATGTDGQAKSQQSESDQTRSAQTRSAQTPSERTGQSQQQPSNSLSGMNQEEVKRLQRQLQQRGHYEGSIDGIAGPQTSAALRSFQVGKGLANSGQLDEETMTALGLDFERQPVSGTEMPEEQSAVGREQRSAPANERASNSNSAVPQPSAGEVENDYELSALGSEQIRELQVRLQERGYYRGEIDGVAGPQTRAALRQFFQRQAQLVAQGKLTESALSAFGMDASEIQPVRGTEPPEPQRK